MDLVFKEECYAIVGACFEVYKEKGCAFLEPVYQECLQLEFGFQSIPANSQSLLSLFYKDHELVQKYIPDFICYEKIIVEIKAARSLADEHRAQVHNYLKATGYKLGILANFGHYPQLEWERIVR
jgi:GxxExxY protein